MASPMQANKYSCLISLYAKERVEYLDNCLNSIMKQTIPPEEIVIVKDGPLSEPLENCLNKYDALFPGLFTFVSYENNRGLWYALSVGVPACRNNYIMRMDVDDWSAPSRAEKEIEVLNLHPEIGCVGSLVTEFVGSIDNPVALVELPEFDSDVKKFGKRRCPFRHPSLMYRKDAVLRAGNYQEMPLFEDYDLYMRLAKTGCVFYNIQESLVYVRTSQDFYARRGSFSYMRKMLNFKNTCLKRGDLNLIEYLICTTPHIIVCLLPNDMRELIYNRFLRSKVRGGVDDESNVA